MLSLTFLGLSLLIFSNYIDYRIKNYNYNKEFFTSCMKIWGHRGHTKIYEQNSPNSWNHAIQLGAAGVEMDVFYDNHLKDFIVSHHKPYKKINNKLLTFSMALKSLSKPGYVWMDLKEINNINDLDAAITQLKNILTKANRLNTTIVESQEGLLLSKFSKSGLYTSYWTNFSEDTMSSLRYFIKDLIRKTIIVFGDFTALSMPYYHFKQKAKIDYSKFPILLFTVNDIKLIEDYMKVGNIKVILTDENLFTENTKPCPMRTTNE